MAAARNDLRAGELRALPGVLDVEVVDGRMRAASAKAEATVRALLARGGGARPLDSQRLRDAARLAQSQDLS